MLLERTLNQIRGAAPSRADELGTMGYLRWLGALPGDADYQLEATGAYLGALPEARHDPAIAAFCALLRASLARPLAPLPFTLPERRGRRGGARGRRPAR